MGAYGALAVLVLAGWAFLDPGMAWAYVALFVIFEFWLLKKIRGVGAAPVPPGEPPYGFTEDEARVVGRYRFYFTWPDVAKQASSVLSATGLSALLLAPWLTYKGAFLEAVVIGLNIFVVGRLTQQLAPVLALRARAAKGERDALVLLEAHETAWRKIRDEVERRPAGSG